MKDKDSKQYLLILFFVSMKIGQTEVIQERTGKMISVIVFLVYLELKRGVV